MVVLYYEKSKKKKFLNIKSDLTDMQKILNDKIDIFPLSDDFYLVCTKNGRIKTGEFNAFITPASESSYFVYGNFLVCKDIGHNIVESDISVIDGFVHTSYTSGWWKRA